jgi:hypothetical protein
LYRTANLPDLEFRTVGNTPRPLKSWICPEKISVKPRMNPSTITGCENHFRTSSSSLAIFWWLRRFDFPGLDRSRAEPECCVVAPCYAGTT